MKFGFDWPSGFWEEDGWRVFPIIMSIFFFFFDLGFMDFQEYFTYIEPIVHQVV